MSQYRQQQSLDGSAGSRASLASITQMPMITETGEINRAIPKIPLRVPQKNPRRSLPPSSHGPAGSSAAAGPASASAGPAPYVPPDGDYVPASPVSLTASSPISPFQKEYSLETDAGDNYSPEPSTPQLGEGDGNEKQWMDNRQRRCRFMVMVGVLTAVIVGLAVGLSVGLRNKSSSSSGSSEDSGSSKSIFPAGAFSLDTYLRENATDCVSRKTAWSCYPDGNSGSRATFYWTITSFNSYTYTISATDNPFAPSFSNLSVTLLDPNQSTERFTFAFGMNKTVVPADAETPTNRAANCTYTGTVFKATLWTRKRGNETISAPKNLSKFAPWPGDVEIMQYKNSTIGEPHCVDKIGGPIADIQAAGASCMCRYGSASLS